MERLLGILFVLYFVVTFIVSLARRAKRGADEPWDVDVFPFPPDLRENLPETGVPDLEPVAGPVTAAEPDRGPSDVGDAQRDFEVDDRLEVPMPVYVEGGNEGAESSQSDFAVDETDPTFDDEGMDWSEIDTDTDSRRLTTPSPRSDQIAAARPITLLQDRRSLQEALLVREILGPPRAMKPHRPLEWLRP